jgi:hypothetical protein
MSISGGKGAVPELSIYKTVPELSIYNTVPECVKEYNPSYY